MEQKKITKTCINCGLQKPITAFLQITSADGTTYGSICATCRGSSMGKVIVIPSPEEDSSSSSTGNKIDAKAKIFIDQKKIDDAKKQKADAKLEREDLEASVDEHLERKNLKHFEERKHREEFIENKKAESFLNFQPRNPAALAETKKAAQVKQNQIETHSKTEAVKKEINLDSIDADLTQPTEKLHSSVFQQAVQWLGASAPNRKFLTRTNPQAAKTDPVVDFLNDTFDNEPKSPGSSRRR